MKKQILNIFILLTLLNIALASEEGQSNIESSKQDFTNKIKDSKDNPRLDSKIDSATNTKKQDSASNIESSIALESSPTLINATTTATTLADSTPKKDSTPIDSKTSTDSKAQASSALDSTTQADSKAPADSAAKASSTLDSTPPPDSTTSNKESDDEFSILPENTKIEDLFSPAAVIEDTFASFVVGYQALFKSDERLKHGIFFAIDRGWLFVDNKLLLAMSLDGSVGGFYSLNLHAKLSGRFLDGRIIPSLSLGYGLLNHFEGESQHNLHGASATLGLFVDIIKGIGLEASYRVGLHPWHTIKKTPIHKNIQSFMINIKFMDFSI